MQNNVNDINPSQPFTCTVFLNLKLSIYVILSLKKHSLLHIWAETPDNQLLRCEGFAFSSLHTASQAFTPAFPKIACLFNTIWLFGGVPIDDWTFFESNSLPSFSTSARFGWPPPSRFQCEWLKNQAFTL